MRGAITESALLLNEDEDHAERGLRAISEIVCGASVAYSISGLV